MDILQILSSNQDRGITEKVSLVVKQLKESNPRAYKQLVTNVKKENTEKCKSRPPLLPKASHNDTKASLPKQASSKSLSKGPSRQLGTSSQKDSSKESGDDECVIPNIEEATAMVSKLELLNWDAVEDEGGIFAGLQCKLPRIDFIIIF